GELFRIGTDKQDLFTEGFAVISTDNIGDCIAALSRLIVTGADGVDRTVAIPTLNKYENRTILMLDNEQGRRAFGQVMNGSSLATNVRVTLKDFQGTVLDSQVVTLPPYTGLAGYLDVIYPANMVSEKAVYLDIQATGFGVAAVGLETGNFFSTII